MKLKKGDKVLVISGKDKGKRGNIARAFPVLGRIMVEGVNIKKQHVRRKREGQKGQTIEKPMPIDSSNVKIVCGKCDKATRVGYRISEGGQKARVCKKCGAEI